MGLCGPGTGTLIAGTSLPPFTCTFPGTFQREQPWLSLLFIRDVIYVWEKGHYLPLTGGQVCQQVLQEHEEAGEGCDDLAG